MNYEELIDFLDTNNVQLVAVSKTKPLSAILDLYEKGQKHFGENRVQELVDKHSQLPKDIKWHMIGHLQKNKVKYIASFIHLIHSADSLKLIKTINKEAKKNERTIDILIQIKIAQEDTKTGYDFEDLKKDWEEINSLENISIKGLMGMGTFSNDATVSRNEFKKLISYKSILKSETLDLNIVSMGMSGDFPIAIEEGSTMVRIGSMLFGSR